ncbi:MAG: MarR family transcriptional regulator [Firmicutes bacterium]|nr:MarR family transcriptional regulator [Bacillota bacterium]
MPETDHGITKRDYEVLARFRTALRRFLRFSEEAARAAGLTPQQHQLLLAVQGMPGREWATVRELADALQLQHHSVVGLVDRLEQLGLVARRAHAADHRAVEVHLTPQGLRQLAALTAAHRAELRRMRAVWQELQALLEMSAAES